MIGGGLDRTVRASVVRSAARKYKDQAEYKEFPLASHWLIGEQGSDVLANYLLEWLKTNGEA